VVWFSLATKQVLDRVLDLFSFSIFVGLGVITLSFFQSPIFLQLVIFLLPPPGSVFSWSDQFCSPWVGCAGSWLTRSRFLGFVYRPRAQGSIPGSTRFFHPRAPIFSIAQIWSLLWWFFFSSSFQSVGARHSTRHLISVPHPSRSLLNLRSSHKGWNFCGWCSPRFLLSSSCVQVPIFLCVSSWFPEPIFILLGASVSVFGFRACDSLRIWLCAVPIGEGSCRWKPIVFMSQQIKGMSFLVLIEFPWLFPWHAHKVFDELLVRGKVLSWLRSWLCLHQVSSSTVFHFV
jgi:hypothetical protein